MPDLTPVPMGLCDSNLYWERTVEGSKGDLYTVRFERVNEQVRGVLYDYTCNCPAYKRCRHIKQVEGERCGWSELLEGGEMERTDEGWTCPRCGGPVSIRMEGV